MKGVRLSCTNIAGLRYGGFRKIVKKCSYTPLSASRSGLGGLFEDLGPILGVLGVMVSTI